MCLDQKLPFEIPVSTFPTLAKAMKQQSMGTLKQRWEPVQCTGSPVSRTVHVASESIFLLMGIFPSTALLSRSSLTSCDPHLQYLLGAVFLSAAQSLHGETQTFPIRRGSAGVVCNSSMQVWSVCMWLTWAPCWGCCCALHLDSCLPEASLEWVRQWHPSHSSVIMPLRCDRRPKGDKGVKTKRDSTCQIALWSAEPRIFLGQCHTYGQELLDHGNTSCHFLSQNSLYPGPWYHIRWFKSKL